MPPTRRRLFAGLLVLAAAAAYFNSFSVPFLFDDERAIVDNPTIRRLSQLGDVFSPPRDGSGVTGRPLVNLSLALNYAVGGTDPRGYHVFNFLQHAGTALALFGLVRRTLRQPVLAARFGAQATGLAFLTALLWALHPLQTESVTCVIQRTELLAGLGYALTLYCFARAAECHPLDDTPCNSPRSEEPQCHLIDDTVQNLPRSKGPQCHPLDDTSRNPPRSEKTQCHLMDDTVAAGRARTGRGRGWRGLAIGACLLGMASKEVMVTAPLMVLLYDRHFVAGSFAAAWRGRRSFYAALAATWLLLAALVLAAGGARGTAAGFGLGVPWWSYALKQCEAIPHYLRLALWPHPLVLDYGTGLVTTPLAVALPASLLAALAGATGLALRRGGAPGFVGAWFFAILAPSSSIVPLVTQTMAEHRMYLPLAAPVVLVVAAVAALGGRRALAGLGAAAVLGGILTAQRNAVYRSERSIWADTLAKRPDNARAHLGVGLALFRSGHPADGITHLAAAAKLQPASPEMRYNLGLAFFRTGRPAEAIAEYEAALRLHPGYADAHYNLGLALVQANRLADAIGHFEAALRVRPDLAAAHNNLGTALARTGRLPEAFAAFATAVRLDPANAEAHNNLGTAWRMRGDTVMARRHYEEALRLEPAHALARENLARLPAAPAAK